MDFTRPVNPEFAAVLAAGGMTVAEAIALYNGSGGGTGFDLAESGFSMIRYARVEGVGPEFSGGEIDGFAAVRPASVGDSVAVGPQSPTKLLFEDPGEGTPSIGGRVEVRVKELSDPATVGVQVVSATNLVSAGVVLQSVKLAVAPLLTESVTFEVDATVRLDGIYVGDGTDLNVLRWDGAKWIAAGGFSYEGASNAVVMTRLTNEAMWMVERVAAPTVRVAAEAGTVEVEFAPNVGWVHTLERTTDFVNWIEAGSITPTAAEMMQVRDETPPNGNAFYRVRLSRAED
jgi:hypothetical protein